jgi:hypothetical protein
VQVTSLSVRGRATPRRWADEERDESITAAFCEREVHELVRRWDEAAERDAPLAARWVHLRVTLAKAPDVAYAAARDAALAIDRQRITWLQATTSFSEIPDILRSEIFRDLTLLRE